MARTASRSILGLELGLVLLWVLLASILSLITAQVADWNAMTDELVYERLAIAIGQSHSLVPHLHGEVVRSLAQLYPALISPFFAHGTVPESLREAHIANAWLMSSACIPAFLLARRVTGRRRPAYALAVLSVCTPWILYSTVLLTEVAGYPAFLWALLGMQRTMATPSRRNDVLALLGLALAFFARTQFAVLLGVLPVALLLHVAPGGPPSLRVALRSHRVLACVYAVLVAAALAVVASGGSLYGLSVYGSQVSSLKYPPGAAGSVTGHAADLAFGLGILPFVVGLAWLLANVVRPPASRELHAFACIGAVTAAVLFWVITVWDLHIGNFVLDRYLYYLAPVLLLAFLCALLDRRRPHWSLLVPVALVVGGFTTHLQPDFLWSGRFPLSTDSPISSLYRPIADLGGGTPGAAAILAAATLTLTAGFVLADRFVPHDRLTVALVVLLLVAFPLQTAHAFDRLFATNGHSSRPLTQSQGGVLDWLDLTVGTGARVTQVPYPISTNFQVSQQYWRDLEFWNKSVRYGVRYPTSDVYADAVIWFPNNPIAFDPVTGAASASLTPYVVHSVSETRFRIAGVVERQDDQVMLVRAEMPWRADWLTSGLYDDGWMRPGEPTRLRVFAVPGQRRPLTRTVSLHLRTPPAPDAARFAVRSNLRTIRGEVPAGGSAGERIEVCVPAGGFAEVVLTTPLRAAIPGDLKSVEASQLPRQGGLLLADVSVADELGRPCRPRRLSDRSG